MMECHHFSDRIGWCGVACLMNKLPESSRIDSSTPKLFQFDKSPATVAFPIGDLAANSPPQGIHLVTPEPYYVLCVLTWW